MQRLWPITMSEPFSVMGDMASVVGAIDVLTTMSTVPIFLASGKTPMSPNRLPLIHNPIKVYYGPQT